MRRTLSEVWHGQIVACIACVQPAFANTAGRGLVKATVCSSSINPCCLLAAAPPSTSTAHLCIGGARGSHTSEQP